MRALTSTVGLNALTISDAVEEGDATRVRVGHATAGGPSGSTEHTSVLVRRVTLSPDRRVSCGKDPEPQQVYALEVVVGLPDELPDGR